VKTFSKPWRTYVFEQHLDLQHESKWLEYGVASHAEQEALFDVPADEAARMNSLDAHIDVGALARVRESIVLNVLRELYLDSDKGERVETPLIIFMEDEKERPAAIEEGNHSRIRVGAQSNVVNAPYGPSGHQN
jgi:hypothetical protein